MILVTLGTQDKSFVRLLKAIQRQIDLGNIKDEVIVQAGVTKFESNNMKIYDLIPMDELEKLVCKCDLLITHGGVGSILTGLKYNKKVIAAPRLKKYDEHESDHQIQLIDEFSKEGYLLKLDDFDKLDEVIKQAKKIKLKKYKENNKNFVNLIDELISKL